jgi:hypothetical protein
MRAEGARSLESRGRPAAGGTGDKRAFAETRPGASQSVRQSRERYWMAKLAEQFGMIPGHLRGRPRRDDHESMRRYDSELARYAASYARKHPLSKVAMAITEELLHRVPTLGRSRLRQVAQLTQAHLARRGRPRTPRRPRARVTRRQRPAARAADPPGPPPRFVRRDDGERP